MKLFLGKRQKQYVAYYVIKWHHSHSYVGGGNIHSDDTQCKEHNEQLLAGLLQGFADSQLKLCMACFKKQNRINILFSS